MYYESVDSAPIMRITEELKFFSRLTAQARNGKEKARMRAQVRQALALPEEAVVLDQRTPKRATGQFAYRRSHLKSHNEMAGLTDLEMEDLGRDCRQDLEQRSATK